jgi:hypothetical protein
MTRIVIYGAPRTKKTSNQLVQAGARPRVLPSKAWLAWYASAHIVELRESAAGWLFSVWPPKRGELPDQPYNCCALFYREAAIGDAVGYYQGLADLLEKRGVIRNDKWIVQWDGSRLLKDAERPRVELTLTPVAA